MMNVQKDFAFINVTIHNTVFEISNDIFKTYSLNITISDVNQKFIIRRQTHAKSIVMDNPSPIHDHNNVILDDNLQEKFI